MTDEDRARCGECGGTLDELSRCTECGTQHSSPMHQPYDEPLFPTEQPDPEATP